MKKLKIGLAAAATALLATPALAVPEIGLIPSVATIEDAASIALNPSGLGWDSGLSFLAGAQSAETSLSPVLSSPGLASSMVAFGFGGGGLGLRMEGERQEVAFATAIPLAPGFRGGLSYRLGRLGDRTGGDYDFGTLIRPANWLSIGAAVRNLGGQVPGESRNYQIGLAFRPFSDRLTISLDGAWAEGRRILQATPILGLDIEPIDGLFLRSAVSVDPKLGYAFPEVRVGLGIGSPRWDAGGLSGPLGKTVSQLPGLNVVASDTSGYVRFRESRGRSLVGGGKEVVRLDLGGSLGPGASALNLITGLAERPPVAATLEVLDAAARDPQVKGLAVAITTLGTSLADMQEVRNAILKFRASGKPVVAYLPAGGFDEFYLASAANRVLMSPVGTLDFTGFARETLFFKGLLDKIGIKAEFVTTGPYKSAMEPVTQDKMSESSKKQLEALTGQQFEQILRGMAEGRGKATDDIKIQVDRGFVSGPEAVLAGLVDELAPEDAIEEALAKTTSISNPIDVFKRPERTYAWLPPRVAVVFATGEISDGMSSNDLFSGRILGAETIVNALNETREDDRIKAVVVRIDSPGGSVMPSEAIRRAVERVRAVKPVIISMGGVTASGGYWIACGADRLLADPGTITGSIGVFTGKWNASELMDKLGVKAETVSRGKFAGLETITRPMTADERALLQSSAEFTYARFLELVSHARKMPQGKVKDLAGGHIYTGEAARDLGLVDRIGGLLDAIGEAKAAGGVGSEEVDVVYMPEARPFLLSNDSLVRMDATLSLQRAMANAARKAQIGAWLRDPRLP